MVTASGLVTDPESLKLQSGAPALWALVNLLEICNLHLFFYLVDLQLSLCLALFQVPGYRIKQGTQVSSHGSLMPTEETDKRQAKKHIGK